MFAGIIIVKYVRIEYFGWTVTFSSVCSGYVRLVAISVAPCVRYVRLPIVFYCESRFLFGDAWLLQSTFGKSPLSVSHININNKILMLSTIYQVWQRYTCCSQGYRRSLGGMEFTGRCYRSTLHYHGVFHTFTLLSIVYGQLCGVLYICVSNFFALLRHITWLTVFQLRTLN